MAFYPFLYDRVMETTVTTGTGTLTLAGAVTGFQSFAAVGNGNTCSYLIFAVDASGNPTGDWEVGYGTYTSAGTTLSRATILASSNSGSVVSLSAGTKRVALTSPASFQLFSPPGILRKQPPTSGWSWLNQGSSTITSQQTGELLFVPKQASLSFRGRVRTLAASNTYTATMALYYTGGMSQSLDNWGIMLRESSTGKFVSLTAQYSGTAGQTLTLGAFAFTNETTFSTTYIQNNIWPASPMWLRFVDDNTDRFYKFSVDGHNFTTLFSHARTTFCTPTQIGFYADPNANSIDAYLNLTSFEETAP